MKSTQGNVKSTGKKTFPTNKTNSDVINSDMTSNDLIVICKHCGKPIDRVKLRGLSLICPLCGKPQNGESHIRNW